MTIQEELDAVRAESREARRKYNEQADEFIKRQAAEQARRFIEEARIKCTCPLIDVTTLAGPIEYVRADPRGSGCPIHETDAMRDERERAKWQARYGDLDKYQPAKEAP